MITWITFIIFIVVSAGAQADTNPYDSRTMTCAALQEIVQRDGKIIIRHRIGNMTFYADKLRCESFAYRTRAYAGYEPSSDQKHCFLGWECLVL